MAAPKKPKKPSKPEEPKSEALFVRDADLVVDLDVWVGKLNAGNPDAPPWTRASLARAALRRAIRERGEKGEAP